MKITDVNGHEHNVASNSKANAALATGIVGAAGTLLNGGGLLGNLFGGSTSANYVTEKEASLHAQIADLQSRNIARESATQAFTDSAAYTNRLTSEINTNLKDVIQQVITNGVAIQKVDDKVDCNTARLDREVEFLRETYDLKLKALEKDIIIEAEKRCCGDNSIVTYSNATFYPKQIADINTSNTSTTQSTYNPLPNCNPCCR